MDSKSLIDALYSRLLLRDLFGKIVPGVAFMLGAAAGLFGVSSAATAMRAVTTPMWIALAGGAWLLGFALQVLGQVMPTLDDPSTA